jgi:hypothetical protein
VASNVPRGRWQGAGQRFPASVRGRQLLLCSGGRLRAQLRTCSARLVLAQVSAAVPPTLQFEGNGQVCEKETEHHWAHPTGPLGALRFPRDRPQPLLHLRANQPPGTRAGFQVLGVLGVGNDDLHGGLRFWGCWLCGKTISTLGRSRRQGLSAGRARERRLGDAVSEPTAAGVPLPGASSPDSWQVLSTSSPPSAAAGVVGAPPQAWRDGLEEFDPFLLSSLLSMLSCSGPRTSP